MPNPLFSPRVALLAVMLIIGSVPGCVIPWVRGLRSIDDTITDWRDFVWGKRAFRMRYGRGQTGPFQDGFLEGYHDILQGDDGCLPVVPPSKYWNWKYQSAGGQGAVGDWFRGYSAGVQAAKEDGLANLSCIPTCASFEDLDAAIYPKDPSEIKADEEVKPIPESPSVQPLQKTGIGIRGAFRRRGVPVETKKLSKKTTGVKPASATSDDTIPLGTGVMQISPMVPVGGASQAKLDTVTTSRRGKETPLPSAQIPVPIKPLNSVNSIPGTFTPVPVRR